jgi:hypothetical protein
MMTLEDVESFHVERGGKEGKRLASESRAAKPSLRYAARAVVRLIRVK